MEFEEAFIVKKRKQWCAALLAAAVTLSLITVPASAADTVQDAYRAYYDFLQDEKDSIGKPFVGTYYGMSSYPFVKEGGWRNEELLFARLIDFDRNGIPELLFGKELCATAVASVRVYDLYTYKGGQMVRLATAEELSSCIDTEYHGGSDGIQYSARISRDAAGKTYLLRGGKSDRSYVDEEYYYYSVSGGKWAFIDRTMRRFIPDIYIAPGIQTTTGDIFYYAGPRESATSFGARVSQQEHDSRKQKYTAGGQETIALNRGDVDAALNQLSQSIDPNYASHYRAPSGWAAESVNAAIAAGIVPETLQKKYASPITRAEFCALAANYYEKSAGKPITQTASFRDTSDPSVQKMAGLGIVTGIGDGKFNPNGLLTREAAAAILVRLSTALGNPPQKSAPTFDDNGSISGWAVESVGQCQAAGIMGSTGNNQFSPQGAYTREQSMMTLMRMGNAASQSAVATLAINPIPGVTVGRTQTLAVTASPAQVPNRALTWTSSNPSVASVDGNGVVTGVSEGTAVITATAASGVSAQCPVTVAGKRAVFFTAAPTTIRCVDASNLSEHTLNDFDDPADNPKHTATITIQSVEPQSVFSDYSITPKAVLHCTQDLYLSDKPPVLYEGTIYQSITSEEGFFKWTAEDASGTIVDKGVAHVHASAPQTGNSFDVEISLYQLTPGESYTLRFYSYLP